MSKEFLSVARSAKQLVASLRRQRKALALSHASLGEKAGLGQVTVSRIEIELVGPSLKTFFKLLSALDLEIVIRSKKKTTVG